MEFVSFELAKKLKGKGFKEKVIKYYGKHENMFDCHPPLDMNDCGYRCSAPTISQVLKWLREERNFHVSPDLMSDYSVDADDNICEEWTYWSYSIHHIIDGVLYRDYNQFDHIEYQSWEAAAIAGIEYVLDNLI